MSPAEMPLPMPAKLDWMHDTAIPEASIAQKYAVPPGAGPGLFHCATRAAEIDFTRERMRSGSSSDSGARGANRESATRSSRSHATAR